MKRIGAGKFKAQCLALLDEVAREHETIVVTKHGKPVAKVAPVAGVDADLRQELRDSIIEETDIVGPTGAAWKAAS